MVCFEVLVLTRVAVDDMFVSVNSISKVDSDLRIHHSVIEQILSALNNVSPHVLLVINISLPKAVQVSLQRQSLKVVQGTKEPSLTPRGNLDVGMAVIGDLRVKDVQKIGELEVAHF